MKCWKLTQTYLELFKMYWNCVQYIERIHRERFSCLNHRSEFYASVVEIGLRGDEKTLTCNFYWFLLSFIRLKLYLLNSIWCHFFKFPVLFCFSFLFLDCIDIEIYVSKMATFQYSAFIKVVGVFLQREIYLLIFVVVGFRNLV